MASQTGQSLAGVTIFTDLSPRALDDVARHCRWRRYAPEQQIVGYLDDTRDVFFVVDGLVRVVNFSLSGKAVTFAEIGKGKVFGEYAAIDGGPRSANVVALTDCLIASMTADAFWDVLREHPEASAAMLKKLTTQLREISQRVFEFSTMAVKNRIHAELLRLARDHMTGDNAATITPAPTHAEIASRISTHREAVTRELSALTRAGLIDHARGRLIVHDVERLEDMVHAVIGEE